MNSYSFGYLFDTLAVMIKGGWGSRWGWRQDPWFKFMLLLVSFVVKTNSRCAQGPFPSLPLSLSSSGNGSDSRLQTMLLSMGCHPLLGLSKGQPACLQCLSPPLTTPTEALGWSVISLLCNSKGGGRQLSSSHPAYLLPVALDLSLPCHIDTQSLYASLKDVLSFS